MIENAPVGYETYLKTKFTRNAFSSAAMKNSSSKSNQNIEREIEKANLNASNIFTLAIILI